MAKQCNDRQNAYIQRIHGCTAVSRGKTGEEIDRNQTDRSISVSGDQDTPLHGGHTVVVVHLHTLSSQILKQLSAITGHLVACHVGHKKCLDIRNMCALAYVCDHNLKCCPDAGEQPDRSEGIENVEVNGCRASYRAEESIPLFHLSP